MTMPPSRTRSHFGALLLSVTLLATLGVVALALRLVAVRRSEAEGMARVRSMNLAQAVDHNLTATFQRIDLALGTVVGELAETQGRGGLDPAGMGRFLVMEGRLLPGPGFIWITDAHGRAVLGNRDLATVPPWEGRWWFQYCRTHPDAGMIVAKPIIGFLSRRWVLPCVRRYNLPGGAFGGVVVIPVAVDTLQDQLAGYDLGPGGTLVLRDGEGGFVARYPTPAGRPPLAMGALEGSAQLRAFIRGDTAEEIHFARAPYDHVPRMYANRRIHGLPLMVGAGLAEADYLAQWRRDRRRAFATMGMVLAGVWAAAWFFHQAWLNRERHARALAESEAQLNQMQKLDSLGKLAGGVAHDLNNILAAIQAVTQTLTLSRPEDAVLLKALSIIERASNRGRDLVRGLTNFARKDIREPERLDLNTLAREEMEILRRTTRQLVGLALDLEEPLPPVLGERGTLGSALMNLCVNAVDAMPEGGTLTLRTRSLPEGMVALEVADTGTGMPPEVLARALEPFYTTKPVGKGTGLGLSSVYAAAKAHGGTVAIRSAPGAGTEVRLQLPAAQGAKAPEGPAVAEVPALGPRALLLVDDDELIRATLPPLLELAGHRVATVQGGEEALAMLAGGGRFDLVLLDLNMPGMNGLETLKGIRRLAPELPVLLATGNLEDETIEALKGDARALPMSKPFTMAEFDAKCRELVLPAHTAR